MSHSNQASLNPNGIHQPVPSHFVHPGAPPNPYQTPMPYGQPHWQGNAYRQMAPTNPYANPAAAFASYQSPHSRLPPTGYNPAQSYLNYPTTPVQGSQYNSTSMMPPPNSYPKMSPSQMYPPRVPSQPPIGLMPGQHSYPPHQGHPAMPQPQYSSAQYGQQSAYNKMSPYYMNGFLPYPHQQMPPGYPPHSADYPTIDNHHLSAAMSAQQQVAASLAPPHHQHPKPATEFNGSTEALSHNFNHNQTAAGNQHEPSAISNHSDLNSSLNSSLNKNSNSIRSQQQSPVPNNTNAAIIDEASQASTSSSHNDSERTETPKLKQHSHPTTPNPLGSPSNTSMSSLQDDYDNSSNSSWSRTPASPALVNSEHSKKQKGESVQKLYEMGDEKERRPFLDKLVQFNSETGITLNICPHISKNLIDLFKLYSFVKEKGGFAEVTKKKLWKECSVFIKMPIASTTSYTLRKQYIKHLLPFECKFDRNGIDPVKHLASVEANSKKKGKNASALSSPQTPDTNSQSSYPQATTPQLNSSNNQPMTKTQSPNNQFPNAPPPPPDGRSSVPSVNHQPPSLNQTLYHLQQQQQNHLPAMKDENYQRRMVGYYENQKLDLNKQPTGLPPGLPAPSKPVMDDKNTYNYYPNYDYRKAGVLPSGSPFLPPGNQYPPHQAMPGQNQYPPNLQPPSQAYQSTADNYPANYQSQMNQNYPPNQQHKPPTMNNYPQKRNSDFNKFEQPKGYAPADYPHGQSYPPSTHSQHHLLNSQYPPSNVQPPQAKENYPNANEFLSNSFLNNYNKQSTSSTISHRPQAAFDQKPTTMMPPPPAQPSGGPSSFPYSTTTAISSSSPAVAHPTPPHPQSHQPMVPAIRSRDHRYFGETVELVRPVFEKRKRMTAKDIAQVDPWKLMMSLKSGLLAETTWALDVLSILLHDDSTYLYFGLQHLPGLLELLLEHFKIYLSEIFKDLFKDIEIENRRLANGLATDDEPSFEEAFVRSVLEANEKFKEKHNLQPEKAVVLENGPSAGKESAEERSCKMRKSKRIKLDTLSYQTENKQLVLSKCENYTLKNRNGVPVYFVEDHDSLFINDMCKRWDKSNRKLPRADHWKKTFFSSTDFIQRTLQPPESSLQFARKPKSSRAEASPVTGNGLTGNRLISNGLSGNENSSNVGSVSSLDESSNRPQNGHQSDPEEHNGNSCYPRFREMVQVKRFLEDHENEVYLRDSPPLCSLDDYRESIAQKCICFSTLIRNLSFVPGNDVQFSRNTALLLILGRLLLLHHDHLEKKSTSKMSLTALDSLFNEDEPDANEDECRLDGRSSPADSQDDWWWDHWNVLVFLRENALVTISNISGTLNLSKYSEEISLPIFSGLLHWTICPSSAALDNFKTSSISSISPARLSLECLVKLSILEDNVDLILSTPPHNRDTTIFETLVNHLRRDEEQTLREFALVLLYNFAAADPNVARSIALSTDAIQQLVLFIELAEHNSLDQMSGAPGAQSQSKGNAEQTGTTLNMVARAAMCLRCLARVAENRTLFFSYQQRILQLVMSNVLDPKITNVIADVIYECSLGESLIAQIGYSSRTRSRSSSFSRSKDQPERDRKETANDLPKAELKT